MNRTAIASIIIALVLAIAAYPITYAVTCPFAYGLWCVR